MRFVRAATLAVFLAAGLATPALAQPAAGQANPGTATAQAGRGASYKGGGMTMNHMRHDGTGHHNLAMMAQHPRGVIAFYRAELAITAAQEPQWAAFAAVLGDAVVAMHAAAMRSDTGPAQATAPARMDATVAMLTGALGTAKALADTGKALYAILTPDQRALADEFWGVQNLSAPMP